MRDQPSPRTQVPEPSHGRTQRSLVLAVIVTLTAVASTGEAPRSRQLPRPAKEGGTASYGKLPLHFEANQGQTDGLVKFLARGTGYGLFLTTTESVLVLQKPEAARPGEGVARVEAATPKRSSPPGVLRVKLLGADPHPAIVGREELPGKSHYFIGNDPKKWRTDVPQYAGVEYKEVYPGVSLTYYGNQSQLEYDFVVSPGGDPRRIRLGIGGAEAIHVDAEGNLVLSLPRGEVVEKAPIVYQEVDGARKAVAGRFVLTGRGEVGFDVGAYEAHKPLVLDPVLVYSTYLGGSSLDQGYGITVDASGNAYVTGLTNSVNFPAVDPLQAASGGSFDAFVAKVNAAGSALVYSTYLGGSGDDGGYGIAVDASGNAYVTGGTTSINFPTVNALQAANGGGTDVFVAKLNASGSALLYSTYLGGGGNDGGYGIAVDTSGNAYVTGFTSSTNFPTANPLQATYGGGTSDAFVAKLNPAGSALVYSTYLGGSGDDQGLFGIAVDASGTAYVTGTTSSTNFPTANPLQAAYGGGSSNAFVAKLNPTGSAFVYSTYLGGSGGDAGHCIAADASGNAYVAGHTFSTNFPTANALQAAYGGGTDAFVAKLNPAGSALIYSTYLGGSGQDQGSGIAVDASGNAYVTGYTFSTNFPTANPLQAAYGGNYNAFVAKLNAAGSALVYSTYLGGSGGDQGQGIALDASGNAYVTGITQSTNFPTANPFQAVFGGAFDAFVAKIGIHSNPESFFTVTPCRVVDTRNPVGPSGGPALGANTSRSFPVTGLCGIPPTASAVAINVTVVNETDFGDLRLYAAGSPAPSSSTINFTVQKVRANNAIIPLGPGGQIAVRCDMPPASTGQTQFLLDVTGYFQGALTIDIVGINGNMSFSPNPANVHVGQQIVWHNLDAITHRVLQDAGGFDAGYIGPGGFSAPITLGAPGTVGYHCSIHPSMIGTLNVTP
jgi:plastocyanin